MIRLARTALLVAVLLLASVGTASAECAWVLWIKYEFVNVPGEPLFGGDGWTVESAVPNYAACNEAAMPGHRRGCPAALSRDHPYY